MRTIYREIVGAFIFSSDGKVLLGHNKKGGVYEDQLIVSGGGIEDNETKEEALKREVLEETGIDISGASIHQIQGESTGESEKVLKDTGERVLVKMNFHNFEIKLPYESQSAKLVFDDDYAEAAWYTSNDLVGKNIGPGTKPPLEQIGFI